MVMASRAPQSVTTLGAVMIERGLSDVTGPCSSAAYPVLSDLRVDLTTLGNHSVAIRAVPRNRRARFACISWRPPMRSP